MKLIFTCVLVGVFSACTVLQNSGPVYVERPFAVDSVRIDSNTGGSLGLTVTSVGSPCWLYSRYERSDVGSSVSVKVIVKEETGVPCPAIVIPVRFPITLTFSAPGTRQFHFWRSDTSSLDTSITVK